MVEIKTTSFIKLATKYHIYFIAEAIDKKNPVFGKYTFDAVAKTNACNACSKVFTTTHPENLMRHLKRKHEAIYDELDALRKAKKANP